MTKQYFEFYGHGGIMKQKINIQLYYPNKKSEDNIFHSSAQRALRLTYNNKKYNIKAKLTY